MSRVILFSFLLILTIFSSITFALINSSDDHASFADDFESGVIDTDEWTIAGRQQGTEIAEIVDHNGSQSVHLYQESFTEITLEKNFDYDAQLWFQFDMEAHSEGSGPNENYLARSGVTFAFLDANGTTLGSVSYMRISIDRDFVPTTTSKTFPIPDDASHWYDLKTYNLLQYISIDESAIEQVKVTFIAYTTAWGSMNADLWLDNFAAGGGTTEPQLTTPPISPTLSVSTRGTMLNLSWNTVRNADHYTLYYAPYPYTGADTIGQIDMGTNTFFSATLWDGASYYVAITSSNDAGESGYSNVELTKTTASVDIPGLKSLGISDGYFDVYEVKDSNFAEAFVTEYLARKGTNLLVQVAGVWLTGPSAAISAIETSVTTVLQATGLIPTFSLMCVPTGENSVLPIILVKPAYFDWMNDLGKIRLDLFSINSTENSLVELGVNMERLLIPGASSAFTIVDDIASGGIRLENNGNYSYGTDLAGSKLYAFIPKKHEYFQLGSITDSATIGDPNVLIVHFGLSGYRDLAISADSCAFPGDKQTLFSIPEIKVPRENTLNLSGTWSIKTTSSQYSGCNGEISTFNLSQNGNNLSSSSTLDHSTSCFGGAFGRLDSGSVNGKIIDLEASGAGTVMKLKGTISDDNKTINGTYTWSFANDRGSFIMTKE